jgi:hypothetical protein
MMAEGVQWATGSTAWAGSDSSAPQLMRWTWADAGSCLRMRALSGERTA